MTGTTEVRERPILFSGAMVRALLDGSKTQTRRLSGLEDLAAYPGRLEGDSALGALGYKGALRSRLFLAQKRWGDYARNPGMYHWMQGAQDGEINPIPLRCPYGQPGDRLWVRETWRVFGGDEYKYQCQSAAICFRADDIVGRTDEAKWKPSIFMPRWASRLTLEITDVRVERVQSITTADAIAEGATKRRAGWCMDWSRAGTLSRFAAASPVKGRDLAPLSEQDVALGSARFAYGNLWDSLNEKRGFGWDVNPWVWCLSFRVVQP